MGELMRLFAASIVLALTVAATPASAQTTSAPATPPGSQAQASGDAINPDRPGIADGSAVIGRGWFQLEAGVQQERRSDAGIKERATTIPSLFRIGVTNRFELRVESNTFTHVTVTGPGSLSASSSDFAPISIGAKLQFQESDGPAQPSLGVIGRVFPASGTSGVKTTKTTGDVRFAADWDVTPMLSINPNVGIGRYEGDNGETFTTALFALTLSTFNAAKTLNPFVDISIQAAEGPGAGSAIIVDGGLAYVPAPNVQLDLSGGKGVRGDSPAQWFVAVGLSIRVRER